MHTQLVIAQTHTLRWLTNRTQHQKPEVYVREKERVVGSVQALTFEPLLRRGVTVYSQGKTSSEQIYSAHPWMWNKGGKLLLPVNEEEDWGHRR